MAAGKGSRLGELTKDKPKSFVEINGIKLIEYNISILRKLGIRDINIVIGYKDEMFRDLFKNCKDIHLLYNPFYEMMNVVGSFYMGMGSLDDDFIYLHADTLCDLPIWDKLLNSEGDILLPYDSKPCDDEAMKIRIESNKVIEINKTMENSLAAGEFVGIAKISKKVLGDLKRCTEQILRDGNFGEYFEAVLQVLMNEAKYSVTAIPTDNNFWAEIDFVEDYIKAQKNMTTALYNCAMQNRLAEIR